MKLKVWFLSILVVIVGLVFALIFRETYFRGPHVAFSDLMGKKIIDMHVHVAGLGAKGSGNFVHPEFRKSYKFPIYLKAFSVSEEELLEKGDAFLIEKISALVQSSRFIKGVVLLALDGVVSLAGDLDLDQTQVYVSNDFVERMSKKFENIYYGASIHPYRKNALFLLEQAVQNGAVLVKWIPSIQNIDPSDPALLPFYQKLKELRLPLLIHTGQERSFLKAEDELSDPLRLRVPLEAGVTVIAAHLATTGKNENQDNLDRLLPLFKKYPNLYADVSSLTQVNKYTDLQKVRNEVFTNEDISARLLYGSDYPLIRTPLVSPYFFPLDLKWSEMSFLQGIEHPWDRDVALKIRLGFPRGVFFRFQDLFKRSHSRE